MHGQTLKEESSKEEEKCPEVVAFRYKRSYVQHVSHRHLTKLTAEINWHKILTIVKGFLLRSDIQRLQVNSAWAHRRTVSKLQCIRSWQVQASIINCAQKRYPASRPVCSSEWNNVLQAFFAIFTGLADVPTFSKAIPYIGKDIFRNAFTSERGKTWQLVFEKVRNARLQMRNLKTAAHVKLI